MSHHCRMQINALSQDLDISLRKTPLDYVLNDFPEIVNSEYFEFCRLAELLKSFWDSTRKLNSQDAHSLSFAASFLFSALMTLDKNCDIEVQIIL